MPIPKPRKNEKESEYISRCMSDEVMKKEFPKQDQRSAVCYREWRNKNKGEEEEKKKKKDKDKDKNNCE